MSTAVVTQSIQESANKAGKAPNRISLPAFHHNRHHCHQEISGIPLQSTPQTHTTRDSRVSPPLVETLSQKW
jgi:hypothetical protein